MGKPTNIHQDIVAELSRDAIALDLARALEGLFFVSGYRKLRKYDAPFTTMFCKPTESIANALLIEREVLALVANFSDIQARTIQIAEDIIASRAPQLDRQLAIILHADKSGDEKLRSWGREKGLTVIPLHRPSGGVLPPSTEVRQRLARELFASDPFAVTGPVIEDIDFFGRRNEAVELVRQLQQGRIRSLFGIRKVGKTSLINRSIKLAREVGTPKIAMVDCSLRQFYQLPATDALQAVAKVCKMAATRGYAHIADGLRSSDRVQDFGAWLKEQKVPLVLVFDEVDYITPDSTVSSHWKGDFAELWRELRVVIQEAQRHSAPIALLVSGVSSRCFHVERIGEVENPVLQFLPDACLAPFERGATEAMLRDLGKRCGLQWTDAARTAVAEACGDFPYWVRLAGSYMHRAIPLEGRPALLDETKVGPMLEQFVALEGGAVAQLAVENLRRVYPELYRKLELCISTGSLPLGEGALLVRYGLAKQLGLQAVVRSAMLMEGVRRHRQQAFDLAQANDASPPARERASVPDTEWAEELATINRRRNLLERRLRQYVRFALKTAPDRATPWHERVLRSVEDKRRLVLQARAVDVLMDQLFWKELGAVIEKNWSVFEHAIGDKRRFTNAVEVLNDRPDAHAKDIDPADIALQRRELTWLEERIMN